MTTRWLSAAALTLLGTVAWGQEPPGDPQASNKGIGAATPDEEKPLCDSHPVSGRTVVRARDAGHGILTQRLLESGGKVQVGGGDCPPESTPRGEAAATVGALLFGGQLHCSAVLVAPTMAVTAAHCLKEFDQSRIEFALGADAKRPVQRSSVYSREWHTGYDSNHLGVNDIGYVFLSHEITEATPTSLAQGSLLGAGANRSLLYVGYGIGGAQPGMRRCVDIPVHDACANTFSYKHPNMNTCHGDSGGGVFLDRGTDISFVGVTGWGDDACAEYGVSEDVGSYNDWVVARMSRAPRPMPPAAVAEFARPSLAITPANLLREGERFDTYKGKWVTWETRVKVVNPHDAARDFSGACTVLGTAGREGTLELRQLPGGCELEVGRSLWVTGRLARLQGNAIRLELPETADATCPGLESAALDADLRGGLALFRDGRFDQAIAPLEKAASKPGIGRSERTCAYVRLAQSHERIARQQREAAVDALCEALRLSPHMSAPEGVGEAFAKAKARCLPQEAAPAGRLQVALAIAVALKRIPDRQGNHQTLWAPTAFIGFEPLPNRRHHFAIGLALGGGFASNTPGGVVVAGAARADVWRRIGVIGGLGFRFASNDRLRHGWGAGLTFRLWSLTPTPE